MFFSFNIYIGLAALDSVGLGAMAYGVLALGNQNSRVSTQQFFSFATTQQRNNVIELQRHEKEKILRSRRLHGRAGNSLIGFPSESLVFCPKMSE